MKGLILEKYRNDECLANFRFYKNDLYDLVDALNLPRNGFVCSNGTKAFSMDVLSSAAFFAYILLL